MSAHSEGCSWPDEPIGPGYDHLCGRAIVPGVTTCPHCGNLDESSECAAAGCWVPVTQAHLDAIYAQAWGIPDPGANP